MRRGRIIYCVVVCCVEIKCRDRDRIDGKKRRISSENEEKGTKSPVSHRFRHPQFYETQAKTA